MHTVELLDQAIDVAERLGYCVRHEWLGGSAAGGCEVAGRKILFLDLAQSPQEQLEEVLGTLRRESAAGRLPMPHGLRDLLQVRKIA
jgi:hypothetical protein